MPHLCTDCAVVPAVMGWRLNHCPGQPVPMLDNPFSEVKFPNIQSKPPLAQLEAISSRPITCYLGEETDPHLSTTSFQAVVESDKVSPQPPFLQTKQPQFPQPILISLVLQTLHQLCCPSLDTLQPLNVSLVVRGPKLNTVFEVRPHQSRVQGHDHFPTPAGHPVFDTGQDAVGFLGLSLYAMKAKCRASHGEGSGSSLTAAPPGKGAIAVNESTAKWLSRLQCENLPEGNAELEILLNKKNARALGTSWAKSCPEGSAACPADRAVVVPALAAGELTTQQPLRESGSALSHGLPFPPAHSKPENSQEATSLILGAGQFRMGKASQKD
ncbi:hypothetical protein QYF61_002179 [Mycteria americana]|uniref:Uncharacterized protein n=1 Tax=Mycteria americana TaxID=33587 RepID=A0AAN7S296_MYCAM|nr:hypothetical protein QYF61_002179 [Mycteria americana]